MFLRALEVSGGAPVRTEVTGEVRLVGARIAGDLDCSGARLDGGSGTALFADRAEITGSVFLRALEAQEGGGSVRTQVTGEVRLPAARIGGGLDCSGARLDGGGGTALFADGAEITGVVFLRALVPTGGAPVRTEVTGEVRLLDATIGGLDCSGAQLGSARFALTFSRAEVKGNVYLDALRPEHSGGGWLMPSAVHGQVVLRGARILGRFDGDGARMTYIAGAGVPEEDRGVLVAEQAQISGDVRLRAFLARPSPDAPEELVPCRVVGGVVLKGARVGGSVRCDGAVLCGDGQGGAALSASRADVADGVFLRGLVVERTGTGGTPGTVPCIVAGDLRLRGTRVGGRLDVAGAVLTGDVALSGCHARELLDDLAEDQQTRALTGCWSRATSLALDGFAYDRFGDDEHMQTGHRLRRHWVRQT